MPSAEKLLSATAAKLESAPPNEPKVVENTQKENQNAAEQNCEKNVPAIQQVISIISNKVRNLEKRKVSHELNLIVTFGDLSDKNRN